MVKSVLRNCQLVLYFLLMDPNNSRAIKTTQACIEEEPLSYSQFTLLLAQYKRAVYELIQHVDNPTEMLVKP